jgi:5S rRNA maturation endonuclease (ribonuclease M5)
MPDTEPAVVRGINMRDVLAGAITGISIVGVIALACVIVFTSGAAERSNVAKEVLAVVLPLLGSWVGTVLAFYFSKENFEAATRSVTELAKQITPQERLVSTPVRDKMIPKDKLLFRRLPPDQVKLVETLDALDAAKKGNRVPVFADKDFPGYVIHRSMIDRYLADKARQGVDPAKVAQLTLQDLLTESPDIAKAFETSFATVAETASLADAKNAMDRLPQCQDVFVTRRGTKDEEVLGWITNVVIADNSQV